ncbi:MAG: hypothetical protein CV087_11175 [Candidatus Brocadia sp. WS118]|nr:MAG: hypothetical protein CV087_11175 [Candidatus Brocadia sp. WS118]
MNTDSLYSFLKYFASGIIILLLYTLIKTIYNRIRWYRYYNVLKNQFKAKWEILSIDEKIEFLYAIHGRKLKECWDQGKEIYQDKERYKDDHDFGIRSTMLDGVYDQMQSIFDECHKYEDFSTIELEIAFNKLFEETFNPQWIPNMFNIYELEVDKNRFEYIFSNRSNLFKFFKNNQK